MRPGRKATARWRPAVEFDKCYLAVYRDKPERVYLSREAYWLMGKPEFVTARVLEGVVAVSVRSKRRTVPGVTGLPVRFGPAGQPYFVCREVSEAVGPGGRATYDYDEQVRERGRFGARVFYFRKKK